MKNYVSAIVHAIDVSKLAIGSEHFLVGVKKHLDYSTSLYGNPNNYVSYVLYLVVRMDNNHTHTCEIVQPQAHG